MLLLTATLLLTAMPITSTTPDPNEGIQKVLDDIYLGVSHAPKMQPDWAAFERAFLPQATLVLPYRPGGEPKPETLQEFTDSYREMLKNPQVGDTGFFERCAGFEATIFGNVATVVSIYEARTDQAQEKPDRIGLDMVQMVQTPNGWKAISLVTDFERQGNPLPASLAAKRNSSPKVSEKTPPPSTSKESASQDSFFDRLEKLTKSGKSWDEFLTREKLYCGIYHLAAGSNDGQSPHQEDEVYYVVSGQASFTTGEQNMKIKAGDVLFVPAMEAHKFHNIVEDLELLVFFVRNHKG